MIDLRNLFKNFFDTAKVSDDTLKKGVQDHIGRLAANDKDGIYATMLQDTQALYTIYCNAIQTEDNHLAIQQRSTITVDTIITEFKKNISRYEGMVRAIFGTKTTEYAEFFPNGLSEYAHISKNSAEVLMERIAMMSLRYTDKLGKIMLAIFAEHYNNYQQARVLQLQHIGETAVYKSHTADARKKLEIQLCKNLLAIAAEHIGQPEILINFFDQNIFRSNKEKEVDTVQDALVCNDITTNTATSIITKTDIAVPKSKKAVQILFPQIALKVIKISYFRHVKPPIYLQQIRC